MTANATMKDPPQIVLPMTPDKQISSCNDVLVIKDDINAVVKRYTQNNMVLHESKFEYLAYRTAFSKILEKLPFTA